MNQIAQSNWGREFGSVNDAAEALVDDPAKLTGYALIALLKRLNAIAEAVGEQPSRNERFTKIDDPLTGVKVGDTVYCYNVDDEKMDEDTVLTIIDGVPYVLWNSSYWGPKFHPVSKSDYAHTKEDAVAIHRKAIMSDIEYCQEKADKLSALKSLLDLDPE